MLVLVGLMVFVPIMQMFGQDQRQYRVVSLRGLHGDSCFPYAINNSGQIVGFSVSAGIARATYWVNGGSPPVDIGEGPVISKASSINGSGQIVGGMREYKQRLPTAAYWT